jgi:hypothetical protein
MSGVRYMCPILAGFGFSRQIFMKFPPSVMFTEIRRVEAALINADGRTPRPIDRETYRQTDMTKITGAVLRLF